MELETDGSNFWCSLLEAVTMSRIRMTFDVQNEDDDKEMSNQTQPSQQLDTGHLIPRWTATLQKLFSVEENNTLAISEPRSEELRRSSTKRRRISNVKLCHTALSGFFEDSNEFAQKIKLFPPASMTRRKINTPHDPNGWHQLQRSLKMLLNGLVSYFRWGDKLAVHCTPDSNYESGSTQSEGNNSKPSSTSRLERVHPHLHDRLCLKPAL